VDNVEKEIQQIVDVDVNEDFKKYGTNVTLPEL
jgi:hypothetical protein